MTIARLRRARGFSLIEVMLVVALIGIVALVGIPYLTKIARRQKLMTQAREVASDLLAARMKAVKRNTGVSVVVTPGSGPQSYHVFRILEPTPPASPLNVHDRLVATSAFNVTPPAGSTITFGGDGRVGFPPNPTPGVIVIEGPPSFPTPNQVIIQADPSGRVRVITPTNWQ